MADDNEAAWLAVIGRSLALLAMHKAEIGDSDLGSKAAFLEALGLPRAEVALMLGTTSDSLRGLLNRRKREARRGNKKKG